MTKKKLELQISRLTKYDYIDNVKLLHELTEVQGEQATHSPASYGFANGLILAINIIMGGDIDDAEKEYFSEPDEWAYLDDDKPIKRKFNIYRDENVMQTVFSSIRATRVVIDQIMQVVERTNREKSLCYTHLENSRLALGKVLAYLDAEDPYIAFTNKRKFQGSKDIAPTVDVGDNEYGSKVEGLDEVEYADLLRDEIQKKVIKRLMSLFEMIPKLEYNFWAIEFMREAVIEGSFARMSLGLELQRIRKERDEILKSHQS